MPLALQIQGPTSEIPQVLQIEGLTDAVLQVQWNDPLPELFATTLTPSVPAKRIRKRLRKFNQNVASIGAGSEAEDPDRFFDNLIGAAPQIGTQVGEAVPLVDQPLENRKFGAESGDSRDRRDIRELQYAIRDLQQSVEELQKLQLPAVRTGSSTQVNLPSHGEYCELLDSQFIWVESNGTAVPQAIVHGLRRVPQGAIPIRNGRDAEIIVEGIDGLVSPASTDVVYARHFGLAGNFSVFILF